MLTPVSFGKGRPHAPRLSQPYTPGKHSDRYWKDAELQVLRDHYAKRGAGYCLSLLPGKSLTQVYAKASSLGLHAAKNTTKRQSIGTSHDAAIKEAWPSLQGRGAVSRLAEQLGLKRHAVSRRAFVLGLTLPHKKEPFWTPGEEALLLKAPVNNPDAASAFFAAHGFKRSPSSIMVRCKRRGVSRRVRDVLSATKAARILGVDPKNLGVWCREGAIVATRRGTDRLPQQGGDIWSIRPTDLRRFVLDNLDRIDIRKVEKHAFVALLVGPEAITPEGAGHQNGVQQP